MLRVDQLHVIRHKVLTEGLPVRQVAREMGVSRNTVKKYTQTTDAAPARRERVPRATPVLDRVRAGIDAILADAVSRSTKKQRLTGTVVLALLIAQGLVVGITTVRDYLRAKRRAAKEVFVPLAYPPGDLAEVDFFEVSVDLAGVRRKLWMFVLRWMYSGRDFAGLYERCDQVSFLDGHVRAFAHAGCVPRRIEYDNLKPAVKKILVGSERELQTRFAALASHYLFEPCFARPREGHDKGGVEARGRGIRLRHMWPVPTAVTLDEMRATLLARVDTQAATEGRRDEDETAATRFVTERDAAQLLPLVPFEPCAIVLAEASSRSLVRVDKADYAVPSTWARREVTAYVGADTVSIRCAGEHETVVWARLRRGRAIRYRYYLRELRRKPQAVRQCAAEITAELGEPFASAWRLLVDQRGPLDAARAFATILGAIVDRDEDTVATALRASLARGEVSLGAILPPRLRPSGVIVPTALAAVEVERAAAVDFDRLLLGEGGAS